MTTDKNVLSLSGTVGEETLVAIQERVDGAQKAAGKRPPGLFERCEIRKGAELYEIGSVPDAIYMLRAGTIRLRTVASRSVAAMPVTTVYHASPDAGLNRPLLGARYFFDRQPVSLSYFAETPCVVYEITSMSLRKLYETDTRSVLQMMYWLIACSDISEVFIPIANKQLGLEKHAVGETQGLLRAVEEFRGAIDDPRMEGLLGKLYDSFMQRRRKRGMDLGLELSIT
jgi:hypothetical protein